MFEDFSGYVLAGGRSSRMGEDKAMLEYRGERFVERAVRVMREVCSNVRVVVSERQVASYREELPSTGIINDPVPDRGALGGIAAALADSRTEYAMILAVDLPLVDSQALSELAAIARSADSDAVVPRQHDGRLQPLCSVFRTARCLTTANELMHINPWASVRDLLQILQTEVVDTVRLSPDPNVFLNVNDLTGFNRLTDL